eukprot:TRINITY_DN1729_c0_g1_i1.p1 TRINITY_DN1729_c0_g1~~TRINITY_DN1729_c0_g1_i1.p1  ORF type:complete len:280 (+),score=82.57 TRINITY_DN1729_c0_g1_i1:45-884(+)
MTVLSYCDHTDLVPYPLPLEQGETEEEEYQKMLKDTEERRKDRAYEESTREVPKEITERLSTLARDAITKTQDAIGELELAAIRKKLNKDANDRQARLEELWPALVQDGELALAAYSANSWNGRSHKTMPGKIILTSKHLLFASDEGNFMISWKDVLSIQKAIELPSYPPHDPHFLPLPAPDLQWGALMVYCARGRLYHFHKIRGGPLLRTNHTITLDRCFLHCDRLWRSVVSVTKLVDERSDYAKKNPAFDYTYEWSQPILQQELPVNPDSPDMTLSS